MYVCTCPRILQTRYTLKVLSFRLMDRHIPWFPLQQKTVEWNLGMRLIQCCGDCGVEPGNEANKCCGVEPGNKVNIMLRRLWSGTWERS